MREPRRLLSEDATEFERQLLRAVMQERPSPLLRARMRRALGLAGAVSWAGNAKAALKALATKAGIPTAVGGLVAAGGALALTAAEPPHDAPAQPNATAFVAPRDEAAASDPPRPELLDRAAPGHVEAGARGAEHHTQLRDEIAALDGARLALQEGSAARGLALLDHYAVRFPAGILQREAGLLRSHALEIQRRGEPGVLQRAPRHRVKLGTE